MKDTVFYAWWLRHRCTLPSPSRNPMSRPSDRLQWVSAWTWFFITVLAVPLIGAAVMPAVADSWSRPVMRPTTAVVEQVTEVPVAVGPRIGGVGRAYEVRVRWVTRAGAVRQGSVQVTDQPRRGAAIRVWATGSGDRVVGSPPRHSRDVDLIFLIANTAVGISLVGYGAHRLLVWRLDRHRLRAWDAELRRLLTPR